MKAWRAIVQKSVYFSSSKLGRKCIDMKLGVDPFDPWYTHMYYRIMHVRTLITRRASRARSSFNALCLSLSLSSSDGKPRVKFIKNATGSPWDDTSEEKVERRSFRASRHSLLRLESFHPRIFRSERINRRRREKAARAARAGERYRARERGKGKEDRSCSPEVSYL